jgi:hypothetical protein
VNFIEKTRRFVRELSPSVSQAAILWMAFLAFTLSSCVSVLVSYAEDPIVAATAMHFDNVAAIQAFATAHPASGYEGWRSEFGPCAESAVGVETMVPGSGNVINRKLVQKIGSDGQIVAQEVIQVFVSGHQVTPDLTQMLGQQITVSPPSGVGGEPGQYMVLSASTMVDLADAGDDVVSLIVVGEPGKLSGTIPVGNRIGSGMDLRAGSDIFIASIPSGAGVLSLIPTQSTIDSNYSGMILAVPQNNQGSIYPIQGSSGAGGCRGEELVAMTTRADMQYMGLTALGQDIAELASEHFLGTLGVLVSSYNYIIQ